ncbi:AMP-binding protein [Streptomyces sp. CA-251387]|uniref:AMP-binding protein n=1 Tax=Streptomyces sp. CA-251387 TaxID=3240064 RepID=UPI003D922C75
MAALGLREGDVVAVLLHNDPVYVDIILACRIGGFSYCPLNWHFSPAEIGYIIEDCAARAVTGHADLLHAARAVLPDGITTLAVAGEAGGETVEYENWLAQQPDYSGPVVAPRGHTAYTSGTTGRPKGVVRAPIPLGDLELYRRRSLEVMEVCFGVRAGCRALVPAPLYHSAPSGFAQWTSQPTPSSSRLASTPSRRSP